MPTWKEITQANPDHSEFYAQRWNNLAASGQDIYGEARLIDAMVDRNSRILDAGAGQGRVGGYLAQQGHDVLGTDIDPVLIGYARENYPEARWAVGDLSTDQIPEQNFDMAVSAGNVMGFLAADGRESALRNIASSLAPTGRVVIGFSSGRGWDFENFLETAATVGLKTQNLFQSWDLRPFTKDSAFLVAVFSVA